MQTPEVACSQLLFITGLDCMQLRFKDSLHESLGYQ